MLHPLRLLSKVPALPGFHLISPSANRTATDESLQGYLACQRLAFACAEEIASLLRPGWTEKQTADLMETFLRDHGVKSFFHHPFVWFGDRTRFQGVKNYQQYQPTSRVAQEGDVFILDVAPLLNGYTCDIGYTRCLGKSPEFDRAQGFLKTLRGEIPKLFESDLSGREIWQKIDERIVQAGYENIHKTYPFGVLGHRIHSHLPKAGTSARLLHFGWQSYWSLLSRGLFGQLLSENFEGDLLGLWAIEPHLGTPRFGAKFEEILVVTSKGAHWLEEVSHAS